MVSIFSSLRSLETLAALEQRPDGLRLVQLAAALGVPGSSVQAAMRLLMGERLVSMDGHRPPLYRIADGAQEDAAKLLDVACGRLEPRRLLAAALRANQAVEFAGMDDHGLLLVVRWDAEPSDEVRLNRMLARVAVTIMLLDHDEVRETLLTDVSLRDRALQSQVIAGSVDRSFPDPSRHGSTDAPLLGRLHPQIHRPSRRALGRIARRFGLAEVRVFGSAVHSDLRSDSDVDIVVRRNPGIRRTLADETALRRDLEGLFGRDVDVFDVTLLGPAIRERADTEGVVLYG